jgi:hypothetical protein
MLTRTANVKYLIDRCDNFMKWAGMLEVPPKMLDNLHRLLSIVYAGAVLNNLNNIKDKTPEQEQLLLLVKQISSKPININNTITITIPLELADWKLIPSKKFIRHLPNNLMVTFSTKKLENNNQGLFDFKNNQMHIYVHSINVDNVQTFDTALINMKETARHELQHYSQLLLYRLAHMNKRNLQEVAGLPPNKVRNKKESIETIHPLKDIEFYTNLQDSIDLFKRYIVNVKKYKKEYAKSWIGSSTELLEIYLDKLDKLNLPESEKEEILTRIISQTKPKPPFEILRRKDVEKWKLASKIFWTKVSYLF